MKKSGIGSTSLKTPPSSPQKHRFPFISPYYRQSPLKNSLLLVLTCSPGIENISSLTPPKCAVFITHTQTGGEVDKVIEPPPQIIYIPGSCYTNGLSFCLTFHADCLPSKFPQPVMYPRGLHKLYISYNLKNIYL